MPEDYLGRPYFDSWAQTDFSTYIEAGWITLDEIDAGKALADDANSGNPVTAMTLQQVLQEDHDHAIRFDAEIEEPPAFSVGQQVITAKDGNRGHTRLPQYARGRRGMVNAYNGAHVFPDLSAKGQGIHQHCYNVCFTAAELWPEAENSHDKVYLDLWQDYLAQT